MILTLPLFLVFRPKQTMPNNLEIPKMATPIIIIIVIFASAATLASAGETTRQFTRKLQVTGYDCSQAKVQKESFLLSEFKNNTAEWMERRIFYQELWSKSIAYPYAITRPWKSLENVVYVDFKAATYKATCPATTLYESSNDNCYHNRARPVITQDGRDMFLLDNYFLVQFAAQIDCREIPLENGDEQHAVRQIIQNQQMIDAGNAELAFALHKNNIFTDLSTAFSPQATSNLITKEVGVSQSDANITCLWTMVALFYRQNSAKIHIGLAVGKLLFNFTLFVIGVLLRVPIAKAFSLCVTQLKKIYDLKNYHQKQRQRTQERLAALQRETLGLAPKLTLSQLTGDHLETLYEVNAHLATRIAELEKIVHALSNHKPTAHPEPPTRQPSDDSDDASSASQTSSSPTKRSPKKKRSPKGRIRRTATGVAYRP